MPKRSRRSIWKRLMYASIANIVSITLLVSPNLLLFAAALCCAFWLGCDGPSMPQQQFDAAFNSLIRPAISFLAIVSIIFGAGTSIFILRNFPRAKRELRARRRVRIPSGAEIKKVVPPLGEYLLYLFLSRPERITLIGDLTEEFVTVYSKFGDRKARVWYYKQVFTSLWPLTVRFFYRWGFLGLVWRLFKRIAP